MSERQAKLKRKNQTENIPSKRKKTKGEIVANVIIVAVIAAVLGLGVWAVAYDYNKNAELASTETVDNAEQTVPTVAEYVAEIGTTFEQFVAEYGLEGSEAVTAETDMNTATEQMTLANYAKISGTDAATLKSSFGLDETLSDNTIMSEVFASLEAQNAENEEVQTETQSEE